MQETPVQSLGGEDPLEKNPMVRGAQRATVHGATKSRTRLSMRAVRGAHQARAGAAGQSGGQRGEQPLGRGSALPRLGAELELRRSGSSLGPSQ